MDNMKKINLTKTLVVFVAAPLLLAACDERIDGTLSTELSTMTFVPLLSNAPSEQTAAEVMEEVPTIALGDELKMTCTVRDMADAMSATRGIPTGTTTYGTSHAVEDVFGTAGTAITLYEIPKGGSSQLMTPNAKKAEERTGSIASFANVGYTWNASQNCWTTTSNINGYRWFEDNQLRFFGVVPAAKAPSTSSYNATAGTISYSYTVSESTAEAQPDLLLGCTNWLTRPDTDPIVVQVPMKHALSGIHFIVDNDYLLSDGVTHKSKDFTVNSITLTGVKNTGTVTYSFNGGTPTITWAGQSGNATYSQALTGKNITQSQTTYDLHGANDGTISNTTEEGTTFLLIPQDLGSVKVTVIYTYKGNTKTITGTLFGTDGAKPSTYGSWLPGKIYDYHINTKSIVAHKPGETLMSTSNLVSYTSQSNSTEIELFGTTFNCADVLSLQISFKQYFKNYTQRYAGITAARMYLEMTDKNNNVISTHDTGPYYDLKTEVPSSYSFSNSTQGDPFTWDIDLTAYHGDIISMKIMVEFCNPATGGKSGTWDLGYASIKALSIIE